MKRYARPIILVLFCLFVIQPIHLAVAYSNVAYHFGFMKSKNGRPASIDEEGFKDIIQKSSAIFLGNTAQKELYLTFNNGYENGYTPKVLDVLKKKKVPATFFVTGYYVKHEPRLLKRMVQEGHLVGNHSWSHPDMSAISNRRIEEEFKRLKEEVSSVSGQKEMQYVRPPSGIFSERMLAVSRKLGYTNVFWSIAYKDWETNDQKGWRYAYNRVISQLHPGGVIMLHTVSKDNLEALGPIIDEARKQGYQFKSLDRLKIKNY